MLADTITAILSALVVAGVALQFAAASGLGVRIVRRKLARRSSMARRTVPAAPNRRTASAPSAPSAVRPPARRRCRDYRVALRAARPNAA